MSDRAYCRAIVAEHARTFHLASRFLPSEKRRAAFAIYAFCRTVDDAADSDADAASRRAALAGHVRALRRTLRGAPDGPVQRELARAVRVHGVPGSVLFELLAGVARDTRGVRYATWSELSTYCAGVASTVGEMCVHVFGVDGGAGTRDRALGYGRTLGLAMQLTNILRDVGEDARRGRCYLPDEDLALFGLSRAEVLSGAAATDERWRPFMAFEIGRARALYEAALPGIALLAPDARRCALACALGYATILAAIERRGYDTFAGRARPTTAQRAAVLWRVVRHGAPAAASALQPSLPFSALTPLARHAASLP